MGRFGVFAVSISYISTFRKMGDLKTENLFLVRTIKVWVFLFACLFFITDIIFIFFIVII